jgi:DNA-directed RNA polymerase specialized sigma24 family protein
MPLSPELLERAKSGRRQAAVAVIAEYYPRIQRIAYALSGREELGKKIVRQIVRQSLGAMRGWKNTSDPMRWFVHHTVLESRQKSRVEMDLAVDPLIRGVETNSAYYPAFIRAVRTLPMQQREAYLLHHGERLDARGLAIAMDCSRDAAENHLREATNALTAYGGDFFPTFTAHLTQTYDRLSPEDELIVPAVQTAMRRRISPRGVLNFSLTTLKLLVIGSVIFLGWKIVPMLKW